MNTEERTSSGSCRTGGRRRVSGESTTPPTFRTKTTQVDTLCVAALRRPVVSSSATHHNRRCRSAPALCLVVIHCSKCAESFFCICISHSMQAVSLTSTNGGRSPHGIPRTGVPMGTYPWGSRFHSVIQKVNPPHKAVDRLLCPSDGWLIWNKDQERGISKA